MTHSTKATPSALVTTVFLPDTYVKRTCHSQAASHRHPLVTGDDVFQEVIFKLLRANRITHGQHGGIQGWLLLINGKYDIQSAKSFIERCAENMSKDLRRKARIQDNTVDATELEDFLESGHPSSETSLLYKEALRITLAPLPSSDRITLLNSALNAKAAQTPADRQRLSRARKKLNQRNMEL